MAAHDAYIVPMAEKVYSYELARYAGRLYHLSVRVVPDFNDVEEFAVVVYYKQDDGSKVQIARIDTAHGRTHFDRLFLQDPDKKDLDVSWYEAEEKLESNWREYARQYEQNHGV